VRGTCDEEGGSITRNRLSQLHDATTKLMNRQNVEFTNGKRAGMPRERRPKPTLPLRTISQASSR
jgi:hypothetical protein